MDASKDPGGMYVEETGPPGAPAIVFIHGAGQSGREWREHMARLGGFHCLAPDLPGYGRSNRLAPASKERTADLVAELIETRVPAGRASVVGISSAGMVIHALLDRHPERVERAVIDGSPPYAAPRAGRALMALFTTALSPFIHTRPVVAMFRATHDPADLRAASRRAFRRAIAECFTTFAAIGAPCPTLLVAGEKESRVRPTNAALAALMPHAEAWFAPGLDHCWQRKAPDLHVRMVEAWLTGQPLPSELRSEPAPSAAAVQRLRADARPQGGMYVEETGTPGSPGIVFIHGAGQSGRIWREHMARLSAFHCLAPDLPGFGQSNRLPAASLRETADLVAELIETRVPAGRAHVVGISSGAVVIHALLDRHPDRVDRAVIDGAPVLLPRGVRAYMLLSTIVLTPFLHTRPVINGLREHRDEEDVRVASRRATARSVVDSFGSFAAIGALCPTLLVAGERETDDFNGMGVRSSNAAVAALMPHATAWFAPGLGHCWQRRDPDLHIRMVEAWVSGQELPSELRPEPAPAPEAVERLRGMVPENWYVENKPKIMRQVRFALPHFRKHFAEAYGKAEGEAIAGETLQRFEVLLPDLPYIGGDENPDTKNLYLTAAMLAIYRSLQARGASVEEAARLIYLGTASFFDSVPTRWLMRWQGRRMLGRKRLKLVRRAAASSQRRRYPDDWVFDFVEGDGKTFEYGVDYTECGAVKYLAREGAPELAPYLCWLDYPQFAAMHLRLDRTETLAQGGRRCDFRLSRGKPVQVEPEFLHV